MKKIIFGFFETFRKISRKEFDPKTTLAGTLLSAVVALVIMSGIYYFIRDVKYLVMGIIVCVALTGTGIHSCLKERNDDRKATEYNKLLKNNSKFRNTKWREEFYNYKISHAFETPDKRGMKYDLKKRYRTKSNLLLLKLGCVFIFFGVFLIIYQTTLINISIGIFGIVLGIICAVRGISLFTAQPVREFYRRDCDFEMLEKSYRKGKILSYKDNGINLGTTHIMVYNLKNVYAIDYRIIYDVVKKIVRVKKYENSVVYTGDEYRYYIEIMVRMPSGSHKEIDVEFNEYQCEMVINEYRKAHYSHGQENIIDQKMDNTVSV